MLLTMERCNWSIMISAKSPLSRCSELISGWICDKFKYRLPLLKEMKKIAQHAHTPLQQRDKVSSGERERMRFFSFIHNKMLDLIAQQLVLWCSTFLLALLAFSLLLLEALGDVELRGTNGKEVIGKISAKIYECNRNKWDSVWFVRSHRFCSHGNNK